MLIKVIILFMDQFVLIVLTFKIHMLKPDYNMNSKLHLTTITASAFTVSLIIIGIITVTATITTTTKTASSSSFIQDAFADSGQEIVLSLNDSSFAPISIGKGEGEGNQVKVVVNYAVQDPMITNDLVKGVMKVYSQNGTLIKTSSSPTPFPASSSGTVRLATTLTNLTAESVTANIVFTNPIKTEIVSNELPVKLDLVKRPQTTTTAMTTTEEEPQKQQQQQMQPKKVTTFGGGEEEEEQQLVPIEPLPQTTTTTTTTASIPTTSTTSFIKEICNDGLDNDVDTRTDLSDEECNSNPLSPSLSQIPASGPTPPPTQPLEQQQQITTATPEICNDGLDNDIDGKIDTQDEDCIVDTLLSPPPTSLQGQSMIEEQDEEEDDEEKRSDGGDDDDRDSQNDKGGEDKGVDNEEQSNDDDEDENDD
jgi:hypothetical protein